MEEGTTMESYLKKDQTSVNTNDKHPGFAEEKYTTDKLMDITWQEYLSQIIVHHIGVGNLS